MPPLSFFRIHNSRENDCVLSFPFPDPGLGPGWRVVCPDNVRTEKSPEVPARGRLQLLGKSRGLLASTPVLENCPLASARTRVRAEIIADSIWGPRCSEPTLRHFYCGNAGPSRLWTVSALTNGQSARSFYCRQRHKLGKLRSARRASAREMRLLRSGSFELQAEAEHKLEHDF